MTWNEVPKDVVLAAINMCDGHTIFKPEGFTKLGVPQEIVDANTRCYDSDGSDKGSITDLKTGLKVDHMTGVYGLSMLFNIANTLKIPYESKMGRGFQARAIQEAVRKHFEGK